MKMREPEISISFWCLFMLGGLARKRDKVSNTVVENSYHSNHDISIK